MALPTTPTRTAASTTGGNTHNTSMFLTTSAFRRADDNSARGEIHVRDVLAGEGYIAGGGIFILADDQNLVGGRLERLLHRSEGLAGLADGRQPDQVVNVELILVWRVELSPLENEPFAPQGGRLGSIPDALQVHQETFGGSAYLRDAPPPPANKGLDALAEVVARAGGAHPQGPAPAVRRNHAPDHHGVRGLHTPSPEPPR